MKKILFIFFLLSVPYTSSNSQECLYCKSCVTKDDGSCGGGGESSLCSDPTTGWAGFCHSVTVNKKTTCTCETSPPRSSLPEAFYEM